MKSFTYVAATAALTSGAIATPSAAYPSFSGGPGAFFGQSLDASQSSAYQSYTSAHPNGPSSSDWSSFTSAVGISGGPPGYFGGATPTGSFATQITGAPFGPGGFGSGHGGFGGGMMGGPFGGHWGQGPFGQSGAWTKGPWTSWFGGSACPASDWPGWTSGTWSSKADWTTWTGCSASVTASSVYTTTTSVSGTATPITTTSFGYKVAQATNSASSGTAASASSTGAADRKVVAGGAAAAALIGAIAML